MADLDVLRRILDGYRPGATVHVDAIRDDLEAAQVRRAQYGGLFTQACAAGWIAPTGRVHKSRSGPRRGGIIREYRVTEWSA